MTPLKLLVDSLSLCIQQSAAGAQLPEPRRRQVLEATLGPAAATGVLDLNQLWAALLKEQGVTERRLAAPFAAVEDFGDLLGVRLVPLQRLGALSPTQRQQLRAECTATRAQIEGIAAAARSAPADPLAGLELADVPLVPTAAAAPVRPTLDEAAEREARGRAARALLNQAAGVPEPAEAPPTRAAPGKPRAPQAQRTPEPAPRSKRQKLIAAATIGAALLAGMVSFIVNADGSARIDLSFVTALQLGDAVKSKDGLQAVITDGRWGGMDQKARESTARQVYEELRGRGFNEISVRTKDGVGFIGSRRNGSPEVTVAPPLGTVATPAPGLPGPAAPGGPRGLPPAPATPTGAAPLP